MDDFQQQKQQIDEEARRVKEEADRKAAEEKQRLVDQEAKRIRDEAEEKARQIEQNTQ